MLIYHETSIAESIRTYDNSIQYDAACAHTLANKYILAWIMKSCMVEYSDCDISDIVDHYIESSPQVSTVPVMPDQTSSDIIRGSQNVDKSQTEGTIVYDIKFYARIPGSDDYAELIIDIEAQNDFNPGYPIVSRGIFYNCRAISSQYNVEFKNAHYEKIKKVYSVWICMNPPNYMANSINGYKISEYHISGHASLPLHQYDLATVIMICLSQKKHQATTGIIRLLDVLLSKYIPYKEKQRVLEDEFQIKMTDELERSVTEMCNLSKGIMDDGIAIGVKKGKRMGKEEAKLNAIKSLVETLNCTPIQAMNFLKLSKAEHSKYLKLLQNPN